MTDTQQIQQACAFTGHRPSKLPFGYREDDRRCLQLKARLIQAIEEKIKAGVTCFYDGMALGVDTFAAEAVLSLRKEHPHIRLVAVCPCGTQAGRWSPAMQERHRSIVRQADEVVVLQSMYTPDCMQRRNRYMVDRAAHLIAVWDGTPGGTASTVEYARGLGRSITVIPSKV